MQFEWDDHKAARNLAKHGVSFDEASSVFGDRLHEVYVDIAHGEEEFRLIIIGASSNRRLLVVVFTQRGENIRVISARTATPRERSVYEAET